MHRDHIPCTVGRKMLSLTSEGDLSAVSWGLSSVLSSLQSMPLSGCRMWLGPTGPTASLSASWCSEVISFQYFQNCLPFLGHHWLWFDPPSVPFRSLSFPSSSMRHSRRHSIQCLVSSSFTRATPFLVEYLCVICISPLLCVVISQLVLGSLFPKVAFAGGHVYLSFNLQCRPQGCSVTETEEQEVWMHWLEQGRSRVCHSDSICLTWIWEIHCSRTPQPSSLPSAIAAWTAWFSAVDSKQSTLVSAEKCSRGKVLVLVSIEGK